MANRLVTAFGFAASLVSLTLACSNAGFDGASRQVGAAGPAVSANGRATDAGASTTAPASTTGKGAEADTSAQPENTPAGKPQHVTGAFLVCASVASPTSSADQATYGCRVQDGNAMADLSNAKVTWAVVGNTNNVALSAAQFATLPAGSPWHTLVSMPKAQSADKAVTADIDYFGGQAPAHLRADLAALAPGVTWTYGTDDQPIHLGNGAFDASSCIAGLGSVPLTGARLTIPFTVPAGGANVTVTLAGVCGVDYDTATSLAVTSAGAAVADVLLHRHDKAATTGALSLPAGAYTVQVTAGYQAGDFDDFLISHVFLESNAAVVAGTVTSAAPDTLLSTMPDAPSGPSSGPTTAYGN